MSASFVRTKTIVASAVSKWRCPGCNSQNLRIDGYLTREYCETVRDGRFTGEGNAGAELVLDVEAMRCMTCNTEWNIEPDALAELRIENAELKLTIAQMRGEHLTCWNG